MMLGLKVPDLKRFDPLKHIDISQRTVEADAWLPSSAMGNNNTADCDLTAQFDAVSLSAMVLGQSIRDRGTGSGTGLKCPCLAL